MRPEFCEATRCGGFFASISAGADCRRRLLTRQPDAVPGKFSFSVAQHHGDGFARLVRAFYLGCAMRVHLIHGIHSTHGGNTSRLAPYFRAAGFDCMVRSYGWALALTSGLTDWLNERRARRLAERIEDGDAIVCHSNGAAVAWHIQSEHRVLSALIMINPALDRETEFNNVGEVLCVHNAGDGVVGWAELAPFSHWGSMGRDGYSGKTPTVRNIDGANPPVGLPRLWGHSALFEPDELAQWGPTLAREMRVMVGEASQ